MTLSHVGPEALNELLSPLTLTDFLKLYVGQQLLHVGGNAAKCASLVSWGDLNAVLETSRMNATRIRVVKDGVDLASSAYLTDPSAQGGSLIKGRALTDLLRQGATLVLNQVEELWPAIRRVAAACEDATRVPVCVNMYASWKCDIGFKLHWDSHDTLIVQISGRKHWQVYEPTRQYPVTTDKTGKPPLPSRPPVWDDVLLAGGVLYMPHGWWHVARPINEPSLHITIGFRHMTGLDLMKWIVQRLHAEVDMRRGLATWREPQEIEAHVDAIRTAVDRALTRDVVETFMRTLDDSLPGVMAMHLPEDAMAETQVDQDTPLRLIGGRCLHIDRHDDETISITRGDQQFVCHHSLEPALRMLHRYNACTIRQLSARVPNTMTVALRAIMTALIVSNVAWAEPRDVAVTRGA